MLQPAHPLITDDEIRAALAARLGDAHVETSLERRTFFSTDMSRQGETAIAVIAPADAQELADAVRICTERGIIVIPRGGGFSYTGGYLPIDQRSVVVDLRRLDTIEIDAENMYVVAGVGCTWVQLYEALKAKGLRTPYFGPMSGYHATVGGALSQGSFFLGSSQYGPVADSTLALEVVLADGTVLRTGSWGAAENPSPFYRSYGPDLTGLFLGDTGALGFKTRAALKLIPFPEFQQYGSFGFDDEAAAAKAVSEIARRALAAECYCWDPYFVKVMSQATTGIAEDLKFLTGVAKGGGSLVRNLTNAARVAVAGKSVFSGDVFLLNVTVDDVSQVGADARLKIIRSIATGFGGREITASAPMAMRGTPFVPFNSPERRRKQRNLPTHGLTTHSRLPALSADVRRLIDERTPALNAVGVEIGAIYFGVGGQAVCLEPILYWDDEEHFLHNRIEETSDLPGLAQFPDRPEATQAALAFRKELAEMFRKHGCAHVQIGKSYPWLDTRDEATRDLLVRIKGLLDPNHVVNRGSLGFAP